MGDKEMLYKRIGFGHRVGLGERPALLVIDVKNSSTNPDFPIGFDQSASIAESQRLLESARARAIPVIYHTNGLTAPEIIGNMFARKIPNYTASLAGSLAAEIDRRVAPLDNEPIVSKKFSSGFFGTNLLSLLTGLRIDTTILVGNSTSGCIRATAIDSISCGFKTVVPYECVADRDPEINAANLFDIDAKYADVVPLESVLDHLRTPAARSASWRMATAGRQSVAETKGSKAEEVYKRIKFGSRVGFGKRPALILLSYCKGYLDSRFPLGFEQSEAIENNQQLVRLARDKGIPIIHVTIGYAEGEKGVLLEKVPALKVQTIGSEAVEIDPRFAPRNGEPVIVRKAPSAFFGTNLHTLLVGLKVDTTILVGGATSGCVRATAIDSISSGFHTIVPGDCVADRHPEIHERNLFDIDSKYADVMAVSEVVDFLTHL